MSDRYYHDDGKNEEQRKEEALTAYREHEIQKQEELTRKYQNRLGEHRKNPEPGTKSQESPRVSRETVRKAVERQENLQRKENRKPSYRLKGLFKKRSYIGCLLPFIVGALYPIGMGCIKIWNACNENIGAFILQILTLPFLIIGVINIFRGFCAVLEKDEKTFELKRAWHFALYLIIMIAGYLAVALAIVQFVLWNG